MNHGSINNQQPAQDVHETMTFKRNKAAYSSPTLVVYGSVGELTQGSGGSTGDANMMMA